MAEYIAVIPKILNAEDKIRREEIFYLICGLSEKIKNHVLNCKTFKKKHNSAHDIDCEICSKLLCFLDLINGQEKRVGEIDLDKLHKMGMIEYCILGNGIKLLE